MFESEIDVLRDVSGRLESAGIGFMLTGSVAMNYFALPRMTRDIDLVVDLHLKDVGTMVSLFEGPYYIDREMVERAVSDRSIFNMIHNESVIKVDCIVLKENAYRKEEFARRRRVSIGDFATWIVTREDLILSKLYWVRDSRSEMQLRDVRNLLSTDCDVEYLRSRARALGVEVLLEEVLSPNE